MALYLGSYASDTGKTYPLSVLRVGIVEGVALLKSRGDFELTDEPTDRQYIPTIFFNECRLKGKSKVIECETLIIKRFAKIYLNSVSYLKVELPFLPNTIEFDNFFIDAYFRNTGNILTLGYEGEFIDTYHLRRL